MDAKAVKCPRCGARAGNDCRANIHSAPGVSVAMNTPHGERFLAAIKASEG